MEKLAEWIRQTDDWIWGPGMLLLLLGSGGYLMLRLRFLPLWNLKYALLSAIGWEEGRKKQQNKKTNQGVSPFSSLTTELAATIGTGNIVGVATAMVLGGPGALFWMLLSSVVGMATKLVESTLAVTWRCKNEAGEWTGGPMYTLQNGFPQRRFGKLLGILFALFAVFASFGMGNMTQSNSIADAMRITFHVPVEKTGLVVTILTILVVLGGIQSIAKVTQVMVPFMGIFYLFGTLLVILGNLPNVPSGIAAIIGMAFYPQAFAGGAFGSIAVGMLESLRWGVSRGVFSNEAGLGAAGISAAAADTEDAVKQGYISMTGVFLDTMVICTMTGLALAASGMLGKTDAEGELLTGTALIVEAFTTVLGKRGAGFISICIALFAFATIVGWAYQGEKAFEFLVKKKKYCIGYRFVYALVAFAGAVCSLEMVWNFSDICNALMAIPNLIGVLVLSKGICGEILRHGRR